MFVCSFDFFRSLVWFFRLFTCSFVSSFHCSFFLSFVRSFFYSCVRLILSFVPLLVRSLVRLFDSSFICSFVRLLVWFFSFARLIPSFVRSSVLLFVHSLVRLFVPLLARSFTRSFVRSFVCSLLRSMVCLFNISSVNCLTNHFENSIKLFIHLLKFFPYLHFGKEKLMVRFCGCFNDNQLCRWHYLVLDIV